VSDRSVTLANFWHPVALSSEVTEQPRQFELLGELIVMFRDAQGVAAFKDLCIHRGAALSLGWIAEGRLTCMYHGWQYDRTGACVHIPALPPDSSIPPKARAVVYRAEEAHGMVWVAMDEPAQPIPPWPEYLVGGQESKLFFIGRYEWKTSAGRAAENGLDFSHFNHSHRGYLELADGPIIKPHSVRQSDYRLDYTYEDGDSRREYIVHSPFTVFIRKIGLPRDSDSRQTWDRDTTPVDGTTVLAQFNSPIDETRTAVFAAIGRNHRWTWTTANSRAATGSTPCSSRTGVWSKASAPSAYRPTCGRSFTSRSRTRAASPTGGCSDASTRSRASCPDAAGDLPQLRRPAWCEPRAFSQASPIPGPSGQRSGARSRRSRPSARRRARLRRRPQPRRRAERRGRCRR